MGQKFESGKRTESGKKSLADMEQGSTLASHIVDLANEKIVNVSATTRWQLTHINAYNSLNKKLFDIFVIFFVI